MYHSLQMSYRELLPILIQNYGISVILARPRRSPYPKGYDVNAICEYHGGVGGNSIENCTVFKDKVQALIDADPTKFREMVSGHQRCSDTGSTKGGPFAFVYECFSFFECTFLKDVNIILMLAFA